ncbi:hypothetical protein O3P69_002943 [Scylla paramamosain]|uniref:Uncharacterized protein n=1 Tax=Scylla paramamosain TaxID=85552 RepID=A0AAW0UJS1_SCYPA
MKVIEAVSKHLRMCFRVSPLVGTLVSGHQSCRFIRRKRSAAGTALGFTARKTVDKLNEN